MDIDLFSGIVKDLLLDNEEITLPGLGTFVSELMPSTFSDKGYTINPPYRRLSFRQRCDESDTILSDFYSETNGIDRDKAEKIVGEFVAGLKETLQAKKVVVLPGLGRLRATKENAFFFIADEDLDLYPYGYGLEPVSLKAHEETPEEIEAVVKELKEEVVPTLTKEVAEETPIPKRKRRPWLVAALSVAGAAVLFIGVFMLLARIAPDFIDRLLYTEEELRIINY
ncbi:MAG: hypothetical protein IKW99_03835 [Bacteroidales bacterium]|nr:hypothetical protein [Bacteroidales bacterium]